MRYKSIALYLVLFILSAAVFSVTYGMMMGRAVQCAISFGCAGGGFPPIFLVPVLVLVLLFLIGYKAAHLHPIILFVVLIILPVPVLLAGAYMFTWYGTFTHEQMVRSAGRHRAVVQLHDAVMYPTRWGDTIVVHIAVPFEVTKSFDARELQYMFDSVKIEDKYPLSSDPVCNEDFFAALSDGYALATHGSLFGIGFYLDPPEGATVSDIARYDYNTRESHFMLSKQRKPPMLVPGRTYYVYDFINTDSPNCTEEDFLNPRVTDPPIFLKR